jgi:hypothetical protein
MSAKHSWAYNQQLLQQLGTGGNNFVNSIVNDSNQQLQPTSAAAACKPYRGV